MKLKDILQAIGILFALITSFFGLLFITKGDILISGLFSATSVVILFFLINEFEKSKTEITKNKLSIKSIFLWTAFLIISLSMSILLIHCFNVEIYAKNDIQTLANSKLNSLQKMTDQYETQIDNYIKNIGTQATTNLNLYLKAKPAMQSINNDSSTSKQHFKKILSKPPFNFSEANLKDIRAENIANKVNNFKKATLIKLTKVSDTIKYDNKIFISKYSSVFNNWQRLKLNHAFYDLDSLLNKNYIKLKNNYKQEVKLVYNKADYPTGKGLMNKPFDLWEQYSPYYLLLIVLLFNTLLLLPYFLVPNTGVYKNKNESLEGGIEII